MVLCKHEVDGNSCIVNKKGKIVHYENNGAVLLFIEFFENIAGHSCEGKAKWGYGWAVCGEDIVKLKEGGAKQFLLPF